MKAHERLLTDFGAFAVLPVLLLDISTRTKFLVSYMVLHSSLLAPIRTHRGP